MEFICEMSIVASEMKSLLRWMVSHMSQWQFPKIFAWTCPCATCCKTCGVYGHK